MATKTTGGRARRRKHPSKAKPSQARKADWYFFVVEAPSTSRARRYIVEIKQTHSGAKLLKKRSEIVSSFLKPGGTSVWLAANDAFLSDIAHEVSEPRGDHRLVLFEESSSKTRDLANIYFRYVLPPKNTIKVLPPEELAEVIASPHREDLFVGGKVDKDNDLVLLFRGNIEPLVVPLAWFEGGDASPEPDPDRFSVTDYGNTVRLGDFEAAADAILYEFDADYRRKARQRERALDESLGGSIRRLRLQRKLRRDEFPGVTDKTIARLERNEIERPRASTLVKVAQALGVPVEDLNTY